MKLPDIEGIPGASEGFDRLLRKVLQPFISILQDARQAPPCVEMKAKLWMLCYLRIFLCDFNPQRLNEDRWRFGVWWRNVGF